MATNPDWHLLDREIEEMLDANPGLEEELDEMERLHEQGKLKLVEHDEVVARRRRLGFPYCRAVYIFFVATTRLNPIVRPASRPSATPSRLPGSALIR